ncbi:hypothetical protein ACIQNG_25590 [Streptomyces sp. NPDC091377]|uniref:hypothetical protein n=1 Tax=Streptomyces sp. NPDC091377 TaxID=3365995 RepID=UPI0038066B90
MDDELTVRALRLLAAHYRARASVLEAEAAALRLGTSVRRFLDLLTEAEAREIAGHPDLAELNVLLNALYERPRDEPAP